MAHSQQQISDNLRDFFTDKGLKQRAVAKMIDTQEADISRMLSSGKIGKTMARKLSKHFGISMNYLLYGIGDMMIEQSDESDLLPITGNETERELDIIARDAIKTAQKDAKDIMIDQLKARIAEQEARIAEQADSINTLQKTVVFAMRKLEEAEEFNKDMQKKITFALERWGEDTGVGQEEIEAIFNAGGKL